MDIIVGALLMGRGGDVFGSAQKLDGAFRETADLCEAELAEYIRPFLGSLARYPGLDAVLIHDGLSADFIERHTTSHLTFAQCEVPARHANYERRHFAFRDWITTRSDVERVWFVDSNDLIFTRHPFDWLSRFAPDPTQIAVGEEWDIYGDSQWFCDAWAKLPPEYGAAMQPHRDRHPFNCGAFGGHRAPILELLSGMCWHLDVMRAHIGTYRTVLDMHGFAHVLFSMPPTSVVPFKMDGVALCADVPSPLVHDRAPALEAARRAQVLGPDELPDELAVRIDLTQRLPGWCQQSKAVALARLILDTRPVLCVEVGVFGGRSALPQALALAFNHSGVLFCVDPYTHAAAKEGDQFGPVLDYWSDDTLNRVRTEFLMSAAALGVLSHVRFLDTRSDQAASLFVDSSIDVLHIDGNHCTEVACRDVRLYLPKVRAGGYIWIDDSDWLSVKPALELLARECRLVRDMKTYRLYRKK